MKKAVMSVILINMAVFFPLSAMAQSRDPNEAVINQCWKEAGNDEGALECAKKSLAVEQKLLSIQENIREERASEQDKRENRDDLLNKVKASHAAFLKYVEEECSLAATYQQNDRSPHTRIGCEIGMIRHRINYLETHR